MALRRTNTLVPIRSQAESILRKLIECADNVNKKFAAAFITPDPESNLPEKVYQEIWRSLRGYICELSSEIQINEIMAMFNNYKSALPGCYFEFNRLPAKKQDVFNALIDFYKVIAIQSFMLRQLSSLGGNLHEMEQKSQHALMQARVNFMKGRDNGGRVKYELQGKISEIENNLKTIAKENPIVSSYSTTLNEEVDQFAQGMIEHIDIFRHEFHAFIRDFQHFCDKYADFRQRRLEALRTPNQAALGNMRESRLQEIKLNLKTLALHLKTINSKNILTFENDLQNPNGTLAEINLIADTLSEFHKTQKEKESELNEEGNLFCQEFAGLQRRLRDLQNPEGEFAKKIDAFLETLTDDVADRYLTHFHHMVDISKFSHVEKAEPVCASLRQHEFDLIRAENGLQVVLRNNAEIVKEVCASRSLLILLEIKRTQNLASSVKHRNDLTESLVTVIDQQYSDIYALISADEQNLKAKWLEVVNVVKETIEATENNIQRLQEAINNRSREEEIHAISHSVDHLSEDIHREIREIQNVRMMFTETSGKYDKIKHALADALRKNLDDAHINAKGAIARSRQEILNDINTLGYEINNYSFTIIPEEQKVKLIDEKQINLLMSEVQNLRASYATKLGILRHAQTHRDIQVRRRECEEIEHQTRRNRQPAQLETGIEAPPSEQQKPGFFRRHWKAITATTTAFALTGAAVGAGVGVAAAVFSAIPTLGLGMIAIPVFSVAGFVLGALTGFASGIIGSISVDHCCASPRENEEATPINNRNVTRNVSRRLSLNTGNIQERLRAERPQHPPRTPAPLTARELGISDLEEIVPELPPLQVEFEDSYSLNQAAASLAK